MEKKKYLWCVISVIVGVVIFVVAGVNKRITFCDEISHSKEVRPLEDDEVDRAGVEVL